MARLQTRSPNGGAALGAAGKATWSTDELDGRSVHAITMVLGGTAFTKAMISAIQLKVGGKVLFDSITGPQLDQMNLWDTGAQEDAAHLTWWFGEPGAANYYGKHVGDLDLSVIKGKGNSKAQLELNVTYAGATAPTLSILADAYLPKGLNAAFEGGEGAQVKTLQYTQIVTGGAVTLNQQIVNIGQHADAAVYGEYWFHDGKMTSLQIYKDSQLLLDNISQTDNDTYNSIFLHTAVANLYVWSPIVQRAVGAAADSLKGQHTPDGAINPNPTAAAIYKHLLTSNAATTINIFTKVLVPYAKL